MTLRELFGIEHPMIQAPMAGVQGGAMAIAVSNAGGLGSLPCAMLEVSGIRAELATIRAQSARPVNVNFFCHRPPASDEERERRWRATLSPYFEEHGIDPAAIPPVSGRLPFGAEAADVLDEFKPEVVSFHFGLPSADLLARVRGCGAKIMSSATTVDEARWLEARGVDAIVAQGLEAGGHRGLFLSDERRQRRTAIVLQRQNHVRWTASQRGETGRGGRGEWQQIAILRHLVKSMVLRGLDSGPDTSGC